MKKTLLDIYTREEIRDLTENYFDYNFDYCPIVITYEEHITPIVYKQNNYFRISLFKEYLIRLLEAALQKTRKIYPDFLKHEWLKNNGYFRELTFTCQKFEEAKQLFWEQLRILADSNIITVHEKKFSRHHFDFILKPENIEKLDSVTKLKHHEYDKTPYSWKWNDVKIFYKELSIKDIQFLHGSEMIPYDEKNDPLFKACWDLNPDKIKEAIKNGADVNGFDEDKNTPIVSLLYDIWGVEDIEKIDDVTTDEQFSNRIIECMKILLENGADINLFAIEGHDILSEAHYFDNIKVMEFIFGNGVRLDLDCFIFEKKSGAHWYINSWVYEDCLADIELGEDENHGYHYKEQVAVMEKYGMTLYIDGWDYDKVADYYGWEKENNK